MRWTDDDLKRVQARIEARDKVKTHRCEGPARKLPTRAEMLAGRSKLEGEFALQLLTLPKHVAQHYPIPGRRWTLDFAWPDRKAGVEVQGGVHRIRDKFRRDIEKRATLMLAGWRVLEVDAEAIRDGLAYEWTKRLLEAA